MTESHCGTNKRQPVRFILKHSFKFLKNGQTPTATNGGKDFGKDDAFAVNKALKQFSAPKKAQTARSGFGGEIMTGSS
jgi:hypothetical protein